MHAQQDFRSLSARKPETAAFGVNEFQPPTKFGQELRQGRG
jgi:hypothetical protein